MKTIPKLITLSVLAMLVAAGCAAPPFKPVSTLPPGCGAVYIYSLGDGPNHLIHNDAKLAALGPNQYLLHFPQAGTNSYAFHQNWITRGGLVGHIFLNKVSDPEPDIIPIEAGKMYYFRAIGVGQRASLLRVDDSTAVEDMQHCRKVEIEKAQQ